MNGLLHLLADQQTFLISTKYMQKLELEKWKRQEDLTLYVFGKVRFASRVLFIEKLLWYSS